MKIIENLSIPEVEHKDLENPVWYETLKAFTLTSNSRVENEEDVEKITPEIKVSLNERGYCDISIHKAITKNKRGNYFEISARPPGAPSFSGAIRPYRVYVELF